MNETAYKDIRNAVGFQLAAIETVRRRCDVAGAIWKFVNGPKSVIRGANRKGTAVIYQEIKARVDTLNEHARYGSVDYFSANMLASAGRSAGNAMNNGSIEWVPTVWWQQEAIAAGISRADLMRLDVEWRFRDLTLRKRHGQTIKNAFRGFWLAGEYDLAVQFLRGKL